ncbi:MAG: DUF3035 domain-containing protein [Pseudomonadota bacterium]|nr:DUF3035 domain-containing protein [Pseudomonadota bacterium]
MMRSRSLVILGVATVMLAACGEIREDLGLGRNPPDEFAVVDRPPLSLPPDFDLRPPQPGAERPQAVNLSQRASDVLFAGDQSATAPTVSEPSDAEKALLETAGANKVDPDIRKIVDREAAKKVVGTTHLVDELLWWKKDEKPATTVDATAEAARIKDAKDKGKPLNEGATPVIERQKTGWLGL